MSGSPKNASVVSLSDIVETTQKSSNISAIESSTDSNETVRNQPCVSSASPESQCSNSLLDTSTSSTEFTLGPNGDVSTSDSSDDDDDKLSQQFKNTCSVATENRDSHKRPTTLQIPSDKIHTSPQHDDVDNVSTCSGSTSGPDSSRSVSPSTISDLSSMCDIISLTATAEAMAQNRSRLFPSKDTYTEPTSPEPSVFSVNLGE